MKKEIKIKCPRCEKEFKYYDSKFRPFCCEKCKMIDLGHWFQESYTVSSNEQLTDEDIDKIEDELNKNEK